MFLSWKFNVLKLSLFSFEFVELLLICHAAILAVVFAWCLMRPYGAGINKNQSIYQTLCLFTLIPYTAAFICHWENNVSIID